MELVEEPPDIQPFPAWVQERIMKLAEAVAFGDMDPKSFTGDSGSSRS